MRAFFSKRSGLVVLLAVLATPTFAQPAPPAPPAPPADTVEGARAGGESTAVILQKIQGGDTVSVGSVYVHSEGGRVRAGTERGRKSSSIDIKVDGDYGENDIVRFGEDITIEQDRTVSGNVVSIGGSVKVMGHVVGDVVSLGGDVRVGSSGEVEGDAVSVGGRVHEEEGSQVGGSNVSVSFIPSWVFGPMIRHGYGWHRVGVWSRLITAVVFIALGWLVVALMGRRMANVCQYVRQRWGLSTAVGFLVIFLFGPAFIMLLITIIGIPIALLLPFALGLALLVGFVAASVRIGQILFLRFGRDTSSMVRSMAGGMIFLLALLFVAALFHAIGGPLHFFAPIFTIAGWVGIILGSLSGLGAVVLSRLGSRLPPQDVPPPAPPTPMVAGPPVSPA